MIVGVDISKYNVGWNPDKAIKKIDFVIQRASWSLYKDEKFDVILPEVQKIPIRGAYHYYSSGVAWKAQADLFLATVKGKGFHFLCVDYERAFNQLSKRTIAEVSEMVKYIKAQSGLRCMVYFSPSIYNESIKPFGYDTWAKLQDIWIAQYAYTETQDPGKTSPAIPDGLPWKIWQYGGGDVNFTAGRHAGPDYGGGLAGIDLNYFNGTAEEMAAWCGAFPTPEIVPVVVPAEVVVVPPSPKYYRILHDTERADMNFKPRKGPNTNPESTPETVRTAGGKGTTILSPAWVAFHDAINTVAAQRFNRKNGSGWFNLGEWPNVQQLTFGGNVVEVTSIEGDRAYIKTYYNDDPPPDLSTVGFYDPARIHYFSVCRDDGTVEGAPVGNVRTFIIARDRSERLYIPLANLVPVDKLTIYTPGEPTVPVQPEVTPKIEPADGPSNLYTFAQNNYWARPGGGPLVLPMSRVRGKADNMSKFLWSALKHELEKLNPTNAKDAIAKISADDWGPTKGLDGKYIKWIGLLWPGRNIVKVSEIIDGYGRVDGVALGSVSVNAYDNPELVSLVYDYHITNGYGERKRPIYVPIIGGPWWIKMDTLFSVDVQLPKKVKVLAAMNLRNAPMGDVIGNQPSGEVVITGVKLGKGGIWGKVAGGWIALRYKDKNMTDWKI